MLRGSNSVRFARSTPLLQVLCVCALGLSLGCQEPRRTLPPGASAPLFSDLGDHHMAITTSEPLAQRYFDQGLILTYGFNHAEAVRSFREAQRLDPDCAACFWGEAYALGPNINRAMEPDDAPPAWQALQRAQAAAAGASPLERDLIGALAKRYAAEAPEDRAPLDRAYADAMREVARMHPDHPDVLALFAESLLDLMPWDYYAADGSTKPEADQAIAALERAIELSPRHPGAIHYYIHAVEKHAPRKAEAAADRLRGLVPGAGHLVHMPSHIYLRVGRYHDASVVNEEAAAADESYITQCRAQGFYPSNYYPHNVDFLQASAAFEGRSRLALETARKLGRMTPAEAVGEFPNVEEFMPRHLFALVRFGRWEQVLEEPEPPGGVPYLKGAWHYARGLAFAATDRADEARRELAALEESRKQWLGKGRVFLSGSSPEQLLEIAGRVLAARIASETGDWDAAVAALRRAAALEDALPYSEPPPWHFPVRDALGQVLLDAGRPAEAEAVFRKQLEHAPGSGWSLHGLAASLRAQGRDAEAAEVGGRFDEAWRRADLKLERAVF